MRAGVGLVAILIAAGLVAWFLAGAGGSYYQTVVTKGNEARSQASQMAGMDEAGLRADQSIAMTADMRGSRVMAFVVTKLLPGGPMEKHFALLVGDRIIQAGNIKLRDWDDAEMAKAMIFEAYQRNQELVVERSGVSVTLPPPTATPAGGPGAAPAGGASPAQNPLDVLKRIPTH